MRRRMVQAFERAAPPAHDSWLQRQFPHLRVERKAVAAAVLWALVAAAPGWWVDTVESVPAEGRAPDASRFARVDFRVPGDTPETFRVFRAGDLLAAAGHPVGAQQVQWLAAERDAYAGVRDPDAPGLRFVGQAALFAVLAWAFLLALARTGLPDRRRTRAEWGIALVALFLIWGGYGLLALGWGVHWLPLGLAVGLVALGMPGLPLAVWGATLVTLAHIVGVGARMDQAGAALAATWLFSTLVRGVRRRGMLVVLALAAGSAGLLVESWWILATGGDPVAALGLRSGGGHPLLVFVLGGGASGLLLALAIRPMESWFGVTTRMRLQTLLDLEHPLVRRLVSEAPGTYNHSVLVGALAEAGAVAVGGDGLLAKAGGYFHDVGKLFKPGYFTENEQGVSRHDRLSPYMSALIIMAHVKDGGELAEAYGLPPAIVHIVRSHHGRSKMAYFLHRARQTVRPGERVAESQFQYPGPLPCTIEAAAVMLADSIEAAARSLGSPGTERLRQLVHQIVMDRLLDRQLDESGLDLTQLARMEDAFFRMLTGMYHVRVKYPGQS